MELSRMAAVKTSADLVALISRYAELEKAGKEWRGLCPFHQDKKTKSLYVNPEKGLWHCFGCGASGDAITFLQRIKNISFKEALAQLEEETGLRPDRRGGLTVEALARAKGLQPQDLIGCEDTLYRGRPAVKIVYPNERGKPTNCVRYRLSLDGEDRFRWGRQGKERIPYGLHWLAVARETGELLLVEGETDAATAWVHGIPALGIPGATMAKVIAPEHLEGIKVVYAVEEPDQGGKAFLTALSKHLTSISWEGELRRIRLTWRGERVKDLNALHLVAGPEFEAAFKETWKHAETITVTDPLAGGFTLPELMAMELSEPKWAIPGLIPEGLSILAGKPKRGKSWFCLGLGIAVASGGYALGKIKVEPGRVLYLALEDRPKRLKARGESILRGEPAPDKLHLFNRWPRLADGGLDLLVKWIKRYPDTRLIMIDTLARIRSPTSGNSSIYELDYAALEGLQNIANAEGLAIIVVHHLRKQDSDDPLDLISGSFGLAASADTLLILRRGHRQADAELHIAARDVEEQNLALKWDPLTTQWVLLGDAEEVKRSQQRNEILALLAEAGEPLTPKQVADLLGKNYNTTKRLLQKMKADGELKVNDRGLYYPVASIISITDVPPVTPVTPVTRVTPNAGTGHAGVTAPLRSVTPSLLGSDADSGDLGSRGLRGSRGKRRWG